MSDQADKQRKIIWKHWRRYQQSSSHGKQEVRRVLTVTRAPPTTPSQAVSLEKRGDRDRKQVRRDRAIWYNEGKKVIIKGQESTRTYSSMPPNVGKKNVFRKLNSPPNRTGFRKVLEYSDFRHSSRVRKYICQS